MPGLVGRWSVECHEAPCWVGENVSLFLVIGGSSWLVHAGCFVVALEVALYEVIVLKGVLDGVAMVMAQPLHYLFKTNRVGPAGLLLVDSIDHHNKLAIMMSLVVLLALSLLLESQGFLAGGVQKVFA
jgi:hypothetical protein